MAEAEYELCDSFHIDGGELDGLSPEQCFVLGVEWQTIAALMDTGRAFEQTMHPANRDRIEARLKRRGRDYRFDWLNDDWLQLVVEEMT